MSLLFYDRNGDGNYNPLAGDYPDYNVTGTNDDSKLYGDQTLFFGFLMIKEIYIQNLKLSFRS